MFFTFSIYVCLECPCMIYCIKAVFLWRDSLQLLFLLCMFVIITYHDATSITCLNIWYTVVNHFKSPPMLLFLWSHLFCCFISRIFQISRVCGFSVENHIFSIDLHFPFYIDFMDCAMVLCFNNMYLMLENISVLIFINHSQNILCHSNSQYKFSK